MKNKMFKKFCVGMLAAAIAVTTMAGSALAASYDAPTSAFPEDEYDENVVTGATAAANTVVLSLLGIDVTSTNGAGIYNSRGTTSSYGTDSANLGIFGSDINDSPDPYLYNFFYNLYNTQSGGGDYSVTDYVAWTAAPYTLLWESNKSGPTGQASGTVEISVPGYTTITTNPAFYYQPDILLGGITNGYESELLNYQSTSVGANYDPVVFLGYNTATGYYAASGTRTDGLGLEYNQFDMTAGVVYLGSVVQNLMNENDETTRYSQGAYEIAVNYDKYDRGLYYYVLQQIANGSLTQVRYTSSLSYDSTTGYYTVGLGTSRAAQYASGIGQDIYELLEDGYTFTGEDTEKTYTQSGSSYLLTVDQLVEILNAPTTGEDASTDATGIIIGSEVSDVDTSAGDLAAAGIRGLDDLPECVYGMTMQTIENGMGIPFYIGFFYYDQDNSLDPVNYIYYWIKNFYHVSDVDSMNTVITNMLTSADKPDGITLSERLLESDEDMEAIETTVEAQIISGINYYQTELEDSYSEDSSLYWQTLDMSVGIGSDVNNTNLYYDCETTDEGTDQTGLNKFYTFEWTEK